MKDFSLVICQINSKYIHSSLSAWYLFASLSERSNTYVLEGTVNEKLEKTAERIAQKSPDAVAFCSYIWNIKTVASLCKIIKNAMPHIKIILGGPEVSYSVQKTMNDIPEADYIISGEGEISFPKLIGALKEQNNTPDILGVSYRTDTGIVENGQSESILVPESPYVKEYFETLNCRISYLETSRGCPYSCSFCLSGKCGKLRFFPLERSLDELVGLANSGTKTIKLVDRTFNADKKRANEIWNFIAQNYGKSIPDGVRIHFEIAPILLDDESLDIISKLPKGAVQFEAGLQSFNNQTLSAINRKAQNEKAYLNLQKLISFGNVHVHTDLIAGLPFESYTSFAESFNRAFAMRPHMLQLGFLKVLSGSQMDDDGYAYKCDHLPDAPYEVISTSWISEDELIRLHKIEDVLERIYNSGRFTRTLEYVFAQTSLSPFMLFEALADSMSYKSSISLDDFTEILYNELCKFNNIVPKKLFDIMLTDRLESIPDSRLPTFFKTDYEKTSKLKEYLLKHKPELFKKGVKRALAALKSKDSGIYADYSKPCDEITGKYEAFIVEF